MLQGRNCCVQRRSIEQHNHSSASVKGQVLYGYKPGWTWWIVLQMIKNQGYKMTSQFGSSAMFEVVIEYRE